MFKKPIKITTSHKISKKDQKKLEKELTKIFGHTESIIESEKSISMKKVEKSKMVIYCNEKDPLIVETTNQEYFPTLYLLNMNPSILKVFLTLKLGVENFLRNGAHLMWPGVKNTKELPFFEADEIVGIRKANGELFAIGAFACCFDEIQNQEKVEGVAAYIFHYYDDYLFNLGSGELQNKKLSMDENSELEIEKKETFQFPPVDEDGQQLQNFEEEIIVEGKKESFSNNDQSEKENKGDEKVIRDSDQEDDYQVEEMDNYIMEAFFNSVYLSLKEDDLPIENSLFWNKHIVVSRNPAINLNIKKSSFKKLGKFFQFLQKEKFIVYKEASKKVVTPQIIRINMNNFKIKNWKVTIKNVLEDKDIPKKEDIDLKVDIKKEIINFCQPKKKINQIFDLSQSDYLYSEFNMIVKNYLIEKKLLEKNFVFVTPEFEKELGIDLSLEKVKKNKKTENKNKVKEGYIKYNDFMKKVDKNLKFSYIILDFEKKSEQRVKGKFEGILITADKMNNRYITKIKNLDIFGVDLQKVLNIWKTKFGTSGSIQEYKVGNSLFKEIILQGGFTDILKDFLVEIGFAKEMIFIDKKCVKPVHKKNK